MSSRPECATPAAVACTFRRWPTSRHGGGPSARAGPTDRAPGAAPEPVRLAPCRRPGPRICLLLRWMGRMGHRFATRPGARFFPHSAPPALSWAFVGLIGAAGAVGLVPVEECGVQWGAVE